MRRVALGVVLLAGCIKGATEEPSEAPPPPAPRTEAAYAEQPDEAATKAVLATLDEEQVAYFEDCRHRFQIPEDEGGGEEEPTLVDECTWLAFDQNCAADPSGCWEGGQQCLSSCASTCVSCDDMCGGDCDGCKAKCKPSDAECVAACATTRVECRDRCMNEKSTCVDKECPDDERQCYDDHEAVVKEKCPKCEQIEECMDAAASGDDEPFEVCRRKFKREPDVCFEWCSSF